MYLTRSFGLKPQQQQQIYTFNKLHTRNVNFLETLKQMKS